MLIILWICLKDIPYAQPPLGDLRFHAPVSPDSWTCVRDASFTEDKICPQIKVNITLSGVANGGLHEASNEDCLYLNVYVPDINSTGTDLHHHLISIWFVCTDPLPVMFWIHGGGYVAGSGRSQLYGPLYYLAHDVVVVAIRYRCTASHFLLVFYIGNLQTWSTWVPFTWDRSSSWQCWCEGPGHGSTVGQWEHSWLWRRSNTDHCSWPVCWKLLKHLSHVLSTL